jgi:hypothetical protein
MVKGGVEANDLGAVRGDRPERVDQLDLPWEVVRRIRRDPSQFFENLGRDSLGPMKSVPAMDDPMTDRRNLNHPTGRHQAIDQETKRYVMIGDRKPVVDEDPPFSVERLESSVGESDSIDLSGEDAMAEVVVSKNRELDARRTAVDREEMAIIDVAELSGVRRPSGGRFHVAHS